MAMESLGLVVEKELHNGLIVLCMKSLLVPFLKVFNLTIYAGIGFVLGHPI